MLLKKRTKASISSKRIAVLKYHNRYVTQKFYHIYIDMNNLCTVKDVNKVSNIKSFTSENSDSVKKSAYLFIKNEAHKLGLI